MRKFTAKFESKIIGDVPDTFQDVVDLMENQKEYGNGCVNLSVGKGYCTKYDLTRYGKAQSISVKNFKKMKEIFPTGQINDKWLLCVKAVGFVDYFNQKYSKKKNASQKNFYPTVDLIIQTEDYGKLIIGFSIRDKSFKLYNWGSLGIEDPTEYDDDVLTKIDKFVRGKLDKMKLDEIISYLNLSIKNKIDWNWIN